MHRPTQSRPATRDGRRHARPNQQPDVAGVVPLQADDEDEGQEESGEEGQEEYGAPQSDG
jgi:hypothetical protein